jgi:nucleoid-associated protein YgaU
MMIRIPPPEVLEEQFPELFPRTQPAETAITPMSGTAMTPEPAGLFLDERQQPRYRVGEKDTLSTIAQRHLGRASRWTEIYELNRDQLTSPSTLKIGMVLKLPPDRSATIVWPEHGFSR